MSLKRLLDHKCNIFHVVKAPTTANYGLPNEDTFTYSAVPDEVEVICHFSVGASVSFEQKDAPNEYSTETKLTLPIGTDIRQNDKVVWLNPDGINYEYTAKIPRNVRNHHKFVSLQRNNSQKAL